MYNVWIVDDEPFILEGLASILDWPSLGLAIAGQAENGRDAIEQIEENNVPVDILITDIAMPEMNGLELMRALKERNPDLKSIVLSGYGEFEYVKEGMQIGIENYLLKPINLEELIQTLVNTVEKLNRSRIEVLSEDQTDLLKDNILYRWVTDRINKEQWKIRSDFLRLRLDDPYVAVAIVKPDPNQVELPSGVAHMNRRQASFYLKKIGIPHLCFQDIDDHTVLIIGAKDDTDETLSRIRQHLDSLGELIGELLGIRPVIAIGTTEPGFDSVPASYRNALLTLDYSLLFPHERLLTHESVAFYADRKGTSLADPEAYARLLLAHDEKALLRQIDVDFEAFSRQEGVTPAELRSVAVEMVIQMKKLLKDLKQSPLISHAYHDVVNRIFQSTTLEQLKGHVRYIAEEVSNALNGRQDRSPVIRQIVNHIHACYMEELSLKTLGHAYRIHPVYLGQLFHKEMNQTFSDYLNRFRIEKAKELMKDSGIKTHDIATAIGYWDAAHFYKHFKKYVGVPPSQYRKLL
jgi:two-component system response regulator YesN